MKIGDKVVPLKKSVWSSLDDSNEWKDAQKLGHSFMYYLGKDIEQICNKTVVALGANFTPDNGGDFFLPGDFIPYVEKEQS